jgi:hypothetical protein
MVDLHVGMSARSTYNQNALDSNNYKLFTEEINPS